MNTMKHPQACQVMTPYDTGHWPNFDFQAWPHQTEKRFAASCQACQAQKALRFDGCEQKGPAWACIPYAIHMLGWPLSQTDLPSRWPGLHHLFGAFHLQQVLRAGTCLRDLAEPRPSGLCQCVASCFQAARASLQTWHFLRLGRLKARIHITTWRQHHDLGP